MTDWGGYESSGGNGMRVGIDVTTESIGHGDAGCTFTVRYYTQNQHTWSDSQSLNLGGSIGGSIGYQNNQGEGVTHRGTRTYVYDYAWDEYGATGKSRTFSATVNGAYNGITPSKSVTVGVPGRPIAAPDKPTGCTVSRINDQANKVSWNKHSTAGEPYEDQIVERWTFAGGTYGGQSWTVVARLGPVAETYSDSGAIPNRKYSYRVKATNGAGSSGYDQSGNIFTAPAPPLNVTRTTVGLDQKITWNDNVGYGEHETQIYRTSSDPALTPIWQNMGTVGGAATSWTDVAPDPTKKWRYMARNLTTVGPLIGSDWSAITTASSGTTTPPNPPSDLAPAGDLVKDPTQPIVLTWQHNPTDGSKQTNWQIQYRVDGGAWSTIDPNPLAPTQATQSMFTLSPGDFAYGQEIEWQVATAGLDPALSDWSEIAGFDTQSLTPVKYPLYLDLTSGRVEALSSGAPSGGGGSAVAAHMHVTRTAGGHSVQTSSVSGFEALALEGTNCVVSESGLAISFTPGGSTPPGGHFTIHETGTYDLSATVNFQGNITGKRTIRSMINGVPYTQIDVHSASATQALSPMLSDTAFLEEGDQVWFECWQNSGATIALNVRGDLYWARVTKVDAAPGPAGPPGPAGGAYTHTQGTPVASWVINHPLPYRPSVTVVDSTGRQVEGDVVYTDADTVTVGFSGAFSGVAYLS